MYALLLSLALGQAEPAVSPATEPPSPPASDSVLAPPPPAATPKPEFTPAPTPRTAAGSLRAVDLTRRSDGTFRATLDGEPVAGAAFYRAVLRPDLAARTEEAQHHRTALLIAAGVAPLAGLGIGWVAGTAQHWPLAPCVQVAPGAIDCTGHDKVRAQNRSAMTSALIGSGLSGVGTGAVLWWLGSRIHPVEPTADEAEALVQAYRARSVPIPVPTPTPTPAPVSDRPAGGASLRLEAGPRGAWLALHVGF